MLSERIVVTFLHFPNWPRVGVLSLSTARLHNFMESPQRGAGSQSEGHSNTSGVAPGASGCRQLV